MTRGRRCSIGCWSSSRSRRQERQAAATSGQAHWQLRPGQTARRRRSSRDETVEDPDAPPSAGTHQITSWWESLTLVAATDANHPVLARKLERVAAGLGTAAGRQLLRRVARVDLEPGAEAV